MREMARLGTTILRVVARVGPSLLGAMLALTAGSQLAQAASLPSAYTGEAAQVSISSATLMGSVVPGNQTTSYYFQYGTTASYEAQTPVTQAGGGTQSIHVSAPVTGLSVYTTYHYRLVAVNSSGSRSGQDHTFTTRKIPLTFSVAPGPIQDPFGSPFTVTGTLSGTASANHAVVLQANPFPFLAGFKAIGAPQLTSASGAFSFPVVGLTENTQLRVATLDTPPVYSRVMVARVAVRVTLHLRSSGRRGFARLYGTVTPEERGSIVVFQMLRPGRRPLRVASALLTRGTSTLSRFSRVVRIRHAGFYRAVVFVASGAQVSNHSRVILIG